VNSRPRYVFLDHTGDAEFRAFGATLEEALANAGLALASLMWDWEKVEPVRSRPVEAEGRDLPQLLVGYLEEILYAFEAEGFLLAAVEDLRLDRNGDRRRLRATLRGDRLSQKYSLRGGVKAVTYNDLRVEEDREAMVQVVVDI
jgi:SHS2 domain-containing protein